MTAWREIYVLTENQIDAEEKYFGLLRRADAMERADLITSDEWRKLVQQAGALLASTADAWAEQRRQGHKQEARRWAGLFIARNQVSVMNSLCSSPSLNTGRARTLRLA